MQKFYKGFTLTVISLSLLWLVSTLFSGGAQPTASAQTKQTDGCDGRNVFVVEDSANRIVHLVYDFSRSTVSIVQIQKGYNPPEITVRTRPLGQ